MDRSDKHGLAERTLIPRGPVFGEHVGRLIYAFSRRKTLAERHKQLRRALQADACGEQRPHETPLLGEKTQPRLAVGSDAEISRYGVSVADLHSLSADDD